MFENLLRILNEIQDETLKALLIKEANLIKDNYLKISNDLIKYEKENKDFLSEKDHLLAEIEKAKNEKSKNAGDEVFKKELENLEAKLKEKNDLFESLNKDKEKLTLDHKLEIELLKNSASLNVVSSKALDIVYSELKAGASLENGKIVYKNEDGTLKRIDGISVDLVAKINQLKNDPEYSFLFKNDSIPGTGIVTNSSSTSYTNTTSKNKGVNLMRERALKMGIKL